ncbi:MAG: hypothetical protein PVI60_15580 [Desulfobacteraceae bacterium]
MTKHQRYQWINIAALQPPVLLPACRCVNLFSASQASRQRWPQNERSGILFPAADSRRTYAEKTCQLALRHTELAAQSDNLLVCNRRPRGAGRHGLGTSASWAQWAFFDLCIL